MNILIIGYGRMGRLIERTALDQGDAISGTVDIGNLGDLAALGRTADVAIDFSAPAALPAVAEFVRASGTPLLSGVTGLSPEQLAVFGELGRYAPVVHSANYSLGIAVFRRALEEVSGVLGDFDIEIVETHHNQKADAPSGTAKILLDAVDPQHRRTPRAHPGLWPSGHHRPPGQAGDRRPRPPGRHRGRNPHRQLLRA